MPGLHLTVDEKVLLHLWAHSMMQDAREAPFQVTQHGIAAAVGIIRSAVPRSVKKLVERGWVEERLAHVGRLNRRRKCYFLTKEGRLECERLRAGVIDSSVMVGADGGGDEEVLVSHLEKATGSASDPLEVVMGTDENGFFDQAGVTARREQLDDFFSQASRSSKAPDDGVTIIQGAVTAGPATAQAGADTPARETPFFIGHPPELKYFFGRDEELSNIEEWYDDGHCRMMVVFGLPGVGKSSIGSKLLRGLISERSDVSALWVKVHKWDGLHSVLGRLSEYMSSLGEGGAGAALIKKEGAGPGEHARTIAGALGEGSLVVLDDLHTAAPDIRDLMGALFEAMVENGRGKVLILSRAVVPFYDRRHVAVDGLIRELELGGLDRESARSLLELKGHDVGGDQADELITASGGHPLYLELFDVGEGAGRSAPGTGAAANDDATDLDTHRNVSRFIEEEVYARLDEPQRLLLERASVFRYPAPKEAFFIDGKADLTSLADLTRRSILRDSDGFYEMHEVLRNYVYRNIPPERLSRIHSGAARFYDDMLAVMRPVERTGDRGFMGHREASEVVHHLIEAGDAGSAADFLLSWGGELVRGPYSEEVEVELESLLSAETASGLAADALCGLKELRGDLFTELGQLDKALSEYERLLEEMKDSFAGGGDTPGCVDERGEGDGGAGERSDLPPEAVGILRRMALIHERKGQLERAFSLLETAEDLARSVRDLRGHIMNLGALGWLHWRQGEMDSSREAFEKSMKHLMKLDEVPGRVKELMEQGLEAAREGDMEGALHGFESSVELLERNEDLFDILRIYDNIGDQYFKVLMTLSMYGDDDGGSGDADG